MPDRDNQVVAGEPSCGTWHYHRWDSGIGTVASTAQQTLSLSAQVPVGTKAVSCYLSAIDNGVASTKWIQVEDASGNRTGWSGRVMVANAEISGSAITPVDGSRNIYWRLGATDIDTVGLVITGYYI